ncbi:MAG TPA: hypothetical protein VI541_05990 [Actinomycetota bacterium]|nr:hypothetical protein [Actinomycetota bacterium]
MSSHYPEVVDPREVPGPHDPYELVGVELPATGEDVEMMARSFVEEFALLGLTRTRILLLFDTPFFAGSHRLRESLGREKIEAIVSSVLGDDQHA